MILRLRVFQQNRPEADISDQPIRKGFLYAYSVSILNLPRSYQTEETEAST